MTATDIIAAFANGLCPVIPSGVYELPSTLFIGGPDKDHVNFNNLCLRGEGRTVLIGPIGSPAVHVYGRNHRLTTVDIVGREAPCLKLGDNAADYVGNCFHGDNLILRGGTIGFFNGKFDGSSLRASIIKECGIAAHCTGNQDATVFDAVTMNDSDVAIVVDQSGRAITRGGVFANNKLVGRVDTAELVMDAPHLEGLRFQDLSDPVEVPAPNGSPFIDLLVNARLTVRNAFYANQGESLWYSARGNAGCRIKFEGGNPIPARANGNCVVLADDELRLPVNYNGVATYIARPWPIEFV